MQTVHIFKDSAKVHGLIQKCTLVHRKKGHLTPHTGNLHTVHRTYSFSGERVHQVLHLCKAKVHLLKATVQPCHAKVNIFQYTAQSSTPQNSDDHNYSTQNSVTVQL